MSEFYLVGSWIRRFLLEHMIKERNLSRNTQASYRDALALLLPFVSKQTGKPVDGLCIEDFSSEVIRQFLSHLEQGRECSIQTRNQRLAAIHAMARFIGEHSPVHVAWCSEIRSIPFKRSLKNSLPYLDKLEMNAMLKAPDGATVQGRRDYAILLFLYNSGARADEVARLAIADLQLGRSASVKLYGKGGKIRHCPLWPLTVDTLAALISGRPAHERVFLNRYKQSMTRYGIYALVKRYVRQIGCQIPSIQNKRVSPHTLRHTTAVHLLRAGIDINTIRAWLGHVSLDTTNIYAEVDLEMKAKALAHCEISGSGTSGRGWKKDRRLMAFLRAL